MTGHAVAFEQVGVRAADGRTILDGVSLQIQSGSTTAVLGRSGSGKTTLLRLVNRLVEPTEGRVLVDGRPASEWDPVTLRRSIGYVVQESGLFPHFSAGRNVGAALEIAGRPKREIADRVHQLFTQVGLDPSEFSRRLPYRLSGGQRQRVGLARALAADPKILLMDEPFGALDPLTRAEMQDMLLELLRTIHKTVILVTHDLNEALYLASHIVLVDGGAIAASLPASQFQSSDNPTVQAYVRAVRRGGRANL